MYVHVHVQLLHVHVYVCVCVCHYNHGLFSLALKTLWCSYSDCMCVIHVRYRMAHCVYTCTCVYSRQRQSGHHVTLYSTPIGSLIHGGRYVHIHVHTCTYTCTHVYMHNVLVVSWVVWAMVDAPALLLVVIHVIIILCW